MTSMFIFDWYQEGSKQLTTAGSSRGLTYLFAFLASLVLSLTLTPPVRALARRLGMVDQPDTRRIHTHPTPRAGGVAIFIAFHATILLCMLIFPGVFRPVYGIDKLTAFFWASLLLLGVGLLDDALSLKPYVKLVGQIAAATLLYQAGFQVGGGLSLTLSDPVNFVVTMFWIVGAVNAFNLIDGMDGLASGLAMIASLGLAGALFLRNLSVDAVPFLALAGATLGFLRYNFNPATVFLGDSGSMFLGLAVGALPLISGQKSELVASLGVPLIAMGIPIFDTVLAIWRRTLRSLFPDITAVGAKRLRGLMQADTDHVHHRVLAKTMSQGKAAILLYGVNILLVAIGLFAMLAEERRIGVFLLAFIVGVFLIVRHLTRVELWDTGRILLAKSHRSISARITVPLYILADILIMAASFVTSHWIIGDRIETHMLVVDMPCLIGLLFVVLAATGAYRRVWPRALLRDFMTFAVSFVAGLATMLALSIYWDAYDRIRLSVALVFLILSLPAMTLIRLYGEILRETVSSIERLVSAADPTATRALVCGGGERFRIFLREKRTRLIENQKLVIVGVLDDDPNLRGRPVYGIRVLGQIDDLVTHVRTHRISRIIITMQIDDIRRGQIAALAREAGVPVDEWVVHMREVT
jgi:UDP-N-acetylmuramyl pentapeptide phosphotransferase/UDP-N-acetylglucosamine-1-phosphate transferase